jgi:hypothetical protein
MIEDGIDERRIMELFGMNNPKKGAEDVTAGE